MHPQRKVIKLSYLSPLHIKGKQKARRIISIMSLLQHTFIKRSLLQSATAEIRFLSTKH